MKKIWKEYWIYLLVIFVFVLVAFFIRNDLSTQELFAKKAIDMTVGELFGVGILILSVHKLWR